MANGKFKGGSGTPADPFIVEDAMDLFNMRFRSNKCFKLDRNINLDVEPFNRIGWEPIPSFSGQLDGNGHKILNMSITKPQMDNAAFISKMEWAYSSYDAVSQPKICNIGFVNAVVAGRINVGILVGCANTNFNLAAGLADTSRAWLKNIHINGSVDGFDNVGGLVGQYIHTYAKAMKNIPMENISVTASLKIKKQGAKGALLIGSFEANLAGSIEFDDVVLEGAHEAAAEDIHAMSVMNVNSNMPADDTHLFFGRCYYDKTKWTGEETFSSKGLTSKEMTERNHFPDMEIKDKDAAQATWTLRKKPQLWFMATERMFIFSAGKYYVLDAGEWKEVFNRMPTLDEAQEVGMKTLSGITEKHWKTAREKFGVVDVISFRDDSCGVTYDKSSVSLTKADSTETSTKKFKTAISFADFKHGIFNMTAE